MKQVSLYFFFLLFAFSGKYSTVSAQMVGDLYNMTYEGGTPPGNSGTLSKFDLSSNNSTSLINFSSGNGYYPFGNLIQYKDGMLYGMLSYGGAGSFGYGGTIFKFNITNGQSSVLHKFTLGGDANTPFGSLLADTNGLIYGMSYYGGSSNSGAIFSFNPLTDTVIVLYSMTNATIGTYPTGNLILATNGLMYGATTTSSGGYGTIFSFNITNNSAALLYNFSGPDGAYPRGSLLQVNDSMLYGLTKNGGANGMGVLFSFNILSGGEAVLVNFNGTNGASPEESLMQASDGDLYGTTSGGGDSNKGTFFRYTIAADTETVLVNFCNALGYSPYDDVIQASNGLLYGNTNVGGMYGAGTVFSYNIDSTIERTLYNYNDTNGRLPYGDFLEVMSASATVTNNLCANDSAGVIVINSKGGKPPFTFLWSTGATTSSISNLVSGAYTYTVTDSTGITIIYSDTVKPLPIAINFIAIYPCNGENNGSISAHVYGGTGPYLYSWNTGYTTDTISNIAAGNYTCTITDAHSCMAMDTIIITQAGILTITGVTTTPSTFPDYDNGSITIHASGGIPPGDSAYYLYLWSNGGSSEDSIVNADSGVYAVCITSPYGCGSVCDSNIDITGLQNIIASGGFIKIYPVPSSGLISINTEGERFESLEITDVIGKQVYKEDLNPKENGSIHLINLSGLADGVYILRIFSTQGSLTGKIIIQKQ